MKLSQIIASLFVIGSAFAVTEEEGKKLIAKCYEEIDPYMECYVHFINVTDEELKKNCDIYRTEKCQNYLADPLKYVPTCGPASGYYSVSALRDMDLKRADYAKACAVKEEVKDPSEELLNKCYEELEPYDECYVDYFEVTPEELQNNCAIYKSEKCQNYWNEPMKYVPTCGEAIGYRSVSMLNRMDESRAEYDDVCAQKVETKSDEKISVPPKIPAKNSNKKQEGDLKSAASTVTSTSALMLFSLLLLIMNY